ncbi:hypothetical protein HYS72_01845 [Candidatus Pacearchaeota archaeon]|nr:hypothetical protein [Candidatus Pacearchaeota archaeon]MBI2057084.1 hypothetical protein [Candidatus Pacearchaeota archaeon]
MSYIEPVDLLPRQGYTSAVMVNFLEKVCLKGEIKKSELFPKGVLQTVNELFSDALSGLRSELPIPKHLTSSLLVIDLVLESEALQYRTKDEELRVQQIINDYAVFNRTLSEPRSLNKKDKELAGKMFGFFKVLHNLTDSAQYVSTLYGKKSKYTYSL